MPSEAAKQRGGIGLLVALFLAVAAALLILGTHSARPGLAVLLSIVVILVTSGIAALLNAMKQTASGDGKRSARQRTAVWLIVGLFAISIGAMLSLVSITEPLELMKTALSGVIVLVGTAVTAVLTMRRSDMAQEVAERGTAAATAEAAAAREQAETGAVEAAAAREHAQQSATSGAAALQAAERAASLSSTAAVQADTARMRAEEATAATTTRRRRGRQQR